MKEHLDFQPIKNHPELVSDSVYKIAHNLSGVLVGEIDPQYMNGAALSEHYDVGLEDGANCIVVYGKRGGNKTMAAVVIPVGYRADLKGLVSQRLGVKSVSMAPLETVIEETDMEYGSITPLGLPQSYSILIDSRLMEKETIIIGGGKQISKLRVPTLLFKQIPNTEIVDNLAEKISF